MWNTVLWGKCLLCEIIDESIFFFFLCVYMCVYILVCGSGCMWVFWHVSLNKSGTLLSCFQETFHEGLWYSPLPTPAPKWCSAFVANLCFSQLAASTRETEHILQTSMRNTLTKQATNSKHGYRNADNVSIFFFMSFPLSLSEKKTMVSVIVCHFVLGMFSCFVWMFRSFPWVLMGKTDLGNILLRCPKVAGPSVFLPP